VDTVKFYLSGEEHISLKKALKKEKPNFPGVPSWLAFDLSEKLSELRYSPVVFPEAKAIGIRESTRSGNRTKQSIGVNILPSYSFTNQRIYQDKSRDSLLEGSWIFSPLYLSQDIPFMFLLTDSKERDVDIDMFVYRDNDGNGYPTNDERVGSGTGPTDREEIFFLTLKKELTGYISMVVPYLGRQHRLTSTAFLQLMPQVV